MATDTGSQQGLEGPAGPRSSPNDDAYRPIITSNNSNQNVIHGPGNIVNYNPNITYIGSSLALQRMDAAHVRITSGLKMRYVPEAVYDAQLGSGCLNGTRVQVLREVDSWIKDFQVPPIFWLTGMAGSGKTTIASTVSSLAHDDPTIVLGGSFFCSRSAGSQAQRDVRCVIPTLAQLYARQSIAFSCALADELARDPDILHKQIGVQVENLLYRPFTALKNAGDSFGPVLFVIDALDECGGHLAGNRTPDDPDSHRIVSDMLEALVSFSRLPVKLPVKFFITSRPETHIRDTPISNASFSTVLRLHTVNMDQVTADIRLYIATRLRDTAQPLSRFTDEDIDMLARLCDGLFIFAATALQYALGAGMDRAAVRLKSLLSATKDGIIAGAIEPLDRMYAVILADAAEVDGAEVDGLQVLLKLLSSILSARMTLSVIALADLSKISPDQLRATLAHLHAVVHVPDNDLEPNLRTLHASFGDYLLERAERRFRIEHTLGDDILSRGCLHVMATRLHFNVSQSQSSYEPNPKGMPVSIPLSLEYACLHWIYHASRLPELSGPGARLNTNFRQRLLPWSRSDSRRITLSNFEIMINEIFRPRLLFWLEVMSVLGQVQRAAAMLIFAAATVKSAELSQFFRDANSFVASSKQAIEQSAPHIYLSALPFAAKDSLVYQEFSPLCSGLIAVDRFCIDHHAGQLVMTLTGHESDVKSVAYALNGTLIASSSSDGTVRIWDTRTSEEATFALHIDDSAVLSVCFSPDGTGIAAGTEGGLVCIWDIGTSQGTMKRLAGHSSAVLSVAFSPDGSLVASTSHGRIVRLWSSRTGRLHAVLSGHTGPVNTVSFSPNRAILVSGSEDGTLRFWQTDSGIPLSRTVYGYENSICDLCFAPDGKTIAAASGRNVVICNTTTGKMILTLSAVPAIIRSVRFSPNGQSLVLTYDRSVCVSGLPRPGGKIVSKDLRGHASDVNSATFSPDGLYIASASADSTLRIWSTGSEYPEVEWLKRLEGFEPVRVAVSPDGTAIFSGSRSGSIDIWDAISGTRRQTQLQGHSKGVCSIAASPDGRFIASASYDSSVRLWTAQTGKMVCRPLKGHESDIRTVVFSPDSQWFASAGDDQTVRIWNIDGTPSTIARLKCNMSAMAIAISPDGRFFAAGDCYGYIQIWKVGTGGGSEEGFRSGPGDVFSLAFSPDGKHLASGCKDWTVQIWDLGDKAPVKPALSLYGHAMSVLSVNYSFDGRLIASGSRDGTCRIWDAETGSSITILLGFRDFVSSVRFAPYGRSIIACGDATSIRAWSLNAEPPTPAPSDGNPELALASATLAGGWLTGPSGELLVWIPEPYRQYMPEFPCTLVIDARGIDIKVGSSGWHRGTNWTSCWRQATPNTAQRKS